MKYREKIKSKFRKLWDRIEQFEKEVDKLKNVKFKVDSYYNFDTAYRYETDWTPINELPDDVE